MTHPIEAVAQAIAAGDMAEADRLLAPLLSLAVTLDGEGESTHQRRLSSQIPIELQALGVDPSGVPCPPGLDPSAWSNGGTRFHGGGRRAFTMREVSMALELLREGLSQRDVAERLERAAQAGEIPAREYTRGSVQAMCRRHTRHVPGYYVEHGEILAAHAALDALAAGEPAAPGTFEILRRALPPRTVAPG